MANAKVWPVAGKVRDLFKEVANLGISHANRFVPRLTCNYDFHGDKLHQFDPVMAGAGGAYDQAWLYA